MEVPKRLYKYRRFDDVTLESIVYDTLYFADPSTFNDPLDSRPSLELDVDEPDLMEILKRLVEQRTKEEMSAALRTGKVRGPERRTMLRGKVASRPRSSCARSSTTPRTPTGET